jgi:hypothetical protein
MELLPPSIQRKIVKLAVRAGCYGIGRVCKLWKTHADEFVNKEKERLLGKIHILYEEGYIISFSPITEEHNVGEIVTEYNKLFLQKVGGFTLPTIALSYRSRFINVSV